MPFSSVTNDCKTCRNCPQRFDLENEFTLAWVRILFCGGDCFLLLELPFRLSKGFWLLNTVFSLNLTKPIILWSWDGRSQISVLVVCFLFFRLFRSRIVNSVNFPPFFIFLLVLIIYFNFLYDGEIKKYFLTFSLPLL